jgi:sodium transport system permease protein
MTSTPIALIYRKELKEALRDRRTLVVMVLLPLCLYPLIAIGVAQWVGAQQGARGRQVSRVGISGGQTGNWAVLREALQSNDRLRPAPIAQSRADGLITVAEAAAAIQTDRADLVLRLRGDPLAAAADHAPATVELVSDGTFDRSRLASKRVERILRQIKSDLLQARLADQGLTPNFLDPLLIARQSVASEGQRSAHYLGQVLPLVLILMVLLGAFYPAIDLMAGEKERGTLETLLTLPVPRITIIAGKFLAVATIACITGLLNLGSIGLTLALGLRPLLERVDSGLQVPWTAVALTAVAIVPTALFFSAIMIAVAALARTFKEAQTLLTPVYLVCMVPALLLQLPGLELTTLTSILPAVNIGLLTRCLIQGQVQPWLLLLTMLSTLLYALIALQIAARIYNSERLLFREDLGSRSPAPAGPRRPYVLPMEAAGLLMLVMSLLLLVGQPMQAKGVIPGILVTEWLLIGLPVLLLLRFQSLDQNAVLSLQRVPGRTYLGAALAGATGWYLVAVFVETVQQRFLPIPPEVAKHVRAFLFSAERNVYLDLFALAVSPAVCEELLFRGVLLSASRRSLGDRNAILLNALLFGVFHLSIYRFVPTAVLGLVLAVLVVRTGSLFPAILFHVLNNSGAILAGRFLGDGAETGTQPGSAVDPLYVGLAAITFLLGLGLAVVLVKKAPPT